MKKHWLGAVGVDGSATLRWLDPTDPESVIEIAIDRAGHDTPAGVF